MGWVGFVTQSQESTPFTLRAFTLCMQRTGLLLLINWRVREDRNSDTRECNGKWKREHQHLTEEIPFPFRSSFTSRLFPECSIGFFFFFVCKGKVVGRWLTFTKLSAGTGSSNRRMPKTKTAELDMPCCASFLLTLSWLPCPLSSLGLFLAVCLMFVRLSNQRPFRSLNARPACLHATKTP
jgi:hypothetical protein